MSAPTGERRLLIDGKLVESESGATFDNVDHAQAVHSLDRVAETGMGIVLPGHGEPWVRRP